LHISENSTDDDSAHRVDLLWILAHPDDEAFGNSGVMTWARTQGLRCGLVCATRGEAGQISDPALADRESLGAVRETELWTAMSLVDLAALRILPFRDSGMAGTPENADPRSLNMASDASVLAYLTAHVRQLQPSMVMTFGPDGVYGHPDHVKIGRLATDAVVAAARHDAPGLGRPWHVTSMYTTAAPREALIAASRQVDGPFSSMPPEALQSLGVPSSEITHWFDVSPFLDKKKQVIRSHATQISQSGPFADLDAPDAEAWLAQEQYVRVALPWDPGRQAPDHFDLLAAQHPGEPFRSDAVRP
jgi:LmbE family N-acetylglucosaminyl deacetylase